MNKYQFSYDAKSGDYRLTEKKREYLFSPRVFAQNYFYRMGETEEVVNQMIFRAGAEDEMGETKNLATQNNPQRYPIVTDIVSSQNTSNFLRNLLYGQDGILTGHLSYMYQGWLWSVKDKVFGDYLKKLGENNGMVLDALGNIVIAFGGDPNFVTANGKGWTSQYTLTTKNKEQFLKSAIAMEERAVRDIESGISRVENASLQRLLTSIKEDKQNVVRDMQNLLNQ